MHTLHIQLKRSPRTVTVGNKTVTIEGKGRADYAHESTISVPTAAPGSKTVPRPKSASVASVIANPVDRSVTPLSQSTAVPVLSSAAQEVVTASEIGLGGVDPEEISRLQQLLADAAEAVQELQTQHRQSLGEMQEVAVELATAAASWLVGYAIDRDMFAVDDLIRKALEHLELNQSVKVWLHPADHTLLQTLLSDPVSRQQLDRVSCMKDESIPRGWFELNPGGEFC
ncbi:MAG: FliH/SctL family protein [Planctomycetaceae bacterium]